MDRLFKIILRTVVTFCNLPLLALSLAGFMSEKAGYSPGLSSVFILLAIMAAGNIVVVWRWRAAAAGPFGVAYKLLRGFLWMVNIVALLVAGVGSSKNPVALYLLLPSGFALLAMMLGGRKNTAEESSVETLQPAAASVQDAAPVSAAAEKPKGNPFAEPDIPAYYAAHRTAVDAMQREFTGLLIDKYGLQPDFVRETFPTRADGVPPAVRWHIDGKTAAQAADEFFNLLYHSPEANNPKIFARHVETGEPLPPDYNHRDWRDKFLGRGADQKVMSVVMLAMGAAFFYGFYGDVFLPSREWFLMSIAIAVLLTVMLGVNLLNRWASGRMRPQPGQRQLKKRDALWLLPLCAVLLWFMVYTGAGSVGNALAGQPMRQGLAYKKAGSGDCLRITETEAFTFAKFCLKASDFDALPQTGFIDISGRRSWFGRSLDAYHMPFSG
ncbi:MAG TPA: hypothetical protein PLX33_02490 [Alphaproteobacteria bacterium]|nr:hypothetical protein [Alphaproteobacteria bacterium]